MKIGVTTSAALHIAILTYGMVSLSAPKPLVVPDVEALPVDIVPIESLTKSIQGEKKADRAEKPAPKPTKKPQTVENAENVGDTEVDKKSDAPKEVKTPPVEKTQAAAPAPRPPEPKKTAPVPVPELAPKPEPKKEIALLDKPVETPEVTETVEEAFEKLPEKVSTPKQRPTARKPEAAATNKREDTKEVAKDETKPTPKKEIKKAEKKTADTKAKQNKDKIAALLNKAEAAKGGAKRSTKKAALGTKKSNNAEKLSQSEVDALRAQIQACWNVGALVGKENADKLRARVEFKLNRNGEIEGKATASASGGDSRENRTFAGSARRAVRGCAPYKLPADKYETWADVVVNFSLKDML